MEISLHERRLTLSAREFAEFRIGPATVVGGPALRNRARIGQEWHDRLRQRAASDSDRAVTFEAPVAGTFSRNDWTVHLQGRIDQLESLTSSRLLLREIKTVNCALPRPEDDLLRDYRAHFLQLAAYLALGPLQAGWEGRELVGELHFIDITEGISQVLPFSDPQATLFDEQMEVLLHFAADRLAARQRIGRIALREPFLRYRDGQQPCVTDLASAGLRSRIVALEAPTGFGKTGIVLHWALGRLRDGLHDRIVYVTGKSTGQLEVLNQLNRIVPEGELRYYQMRGRKEHEIASPMHHCGQSGGCRRDIETHWEDAGLNPTVLIDEGVRSAEDARRIGRRTGVCPYEISRALLPFAEVWVGDYNYVFSPWNRGIFFDRPGFNPARSLLIVDEAHNLPSRVRDAYSFAIGHLDAERVSRELDSLDAAPAARIRWFEFSRFLEGLRRCPQLELTAEYELRRHLESLADATEFLASCFEEMTPATLDLAWTAGAWHRVAEDDGLELLFWSPDDGTLNVTCIDAGEAIPVQLRQFGQTLLMSATFSPFERYLMETALSREDCQPVIGIAPWREQAYRVGIDLRVDTRYRNRQRFTGATAETVLALSRVDSPVAAFFPSYRYAEAVMNEVVRCDPFVRTALQPRGAELADQAAFLESALQSEHVLFLILGSSFAEGIDLLGGRVRSAIVVGPALPEVNPVQQARMDAHAAAGRDEAFKRVYLRPGIVKINQALGRLVREPGQCATILLHGKRFGEPDVQALLMPEYQRGRILRDDGQFIDWLNGDRTPSGGVGSPKPPAFPA